MNIKSLLAFAACALMFVACGDDVTEVNEIHQDGMAVLEAGLELSKQKCDTENVGEMLYVRDSAEVYFCDGESWQTLKGEKGEDGGKGNPGKDGDNGTSCTAEPVKNAAGLKGLEVTCGETVIDTIWNGKDGQNGNNGTSCTAKSVENDAGLEGLEVTCGKTVVGTIWNGEKGEDGDDGENGVGCSVNDEGDGTVTVTCGEGDDATTTTLYKAVCGTKPYDPAKSFCSDDELFSCDDKPYNPKKQYCLEVTRDGSDIYSVEDLLTDARDEEHVQVYKTVKIGDQVWMAENLNYSVNPGEQSWCGGGSGATEGDCDLYGRLYTWAAAIDSVALANDADNPQTCGYDKTCTLPTVVQGVCPEGWHLPSYDEWQTLFTAVGGYSKAGTALKSQTGWKSQTGDAADRDAYGFSALPAGYRDLVGGFHYAGLSARFWSASELSSYGAYSMDLYYNGEDADLYGNDKYYGFSVRCLKN